MISDRQWLRAHGLRAHLMSFALTASQYESGSKTVTRRGGPEPAWCHLKAGGLIEGIEWGSRVGSRWVCSDGCGWLGGKTRISEKCPSCLRHDLEYRSPRRLGLSLVLSVTEEKLADITEMEVGMEGFPGLSPTRFVRGYCGDDVLGMDRPVSSGEWSYMPGHAPASKGWWWTVTRIKFARVIEGECLIAGDHIPVDRCREAISGMDGRARASLWHPGRT